MEHAADTVLIHSRIQQTPDLANVNVGKLRSGVSRSSRPSSFCTTTFSNCIAIVVERSAEKQMRRPDARRRVALVAHPHAVRDWSVCDRPRISRGYNHVASSDAKAAVTVLIGSACPVPARLSFPHLGPKASLRINSLRFSDRRQVGAQRLKKLQVCEMIVSPVAVSVMNEGACRQAAMRALPYENVFRNPNAGSSLNENCASANGRISNLRFGRHVGELYHGGGA